LTPEHVALLVILMETCGIGVKQICKLYNFLYHNSIRMQYFKKKKRSQSYMLTVKTMS